METIIVNIIGILLTGFVFWAYKPASEWAKDKSNGLIPIAGVTVWALFAVGAPLSGELQNTLGTILLFLAPSAAFVGFGFLFDYFNIPKRNTKS